MTTRRRIGAEENPEAPSDSSGAYALSCLPGGTLTRLLFLGSLAVGFSYPLSLFLRKLRASFH